ncbi:MAG TPA: sigma-70 family RNA polymerase sigma factor [Crenalkalicoccus sp.]|nr:sigma-70 family RNA polymerase sigma factor [Crenalkalicoccus sp.]
MSEQALEADLRGALAAMLPELRAFARFLAGSRAEADDLVQEALARSLAALDGGARPGVPLRPWCLAVVRNVFHEQLRARKREALRRARTAEPSAAPAPQEAQGEVRDLAAAIARLPPLLREAVILVGAQGLSYAEAATVIGVPEGTVKARVSRGRRQLAAALGRVSA